MGKPTWKAIVENLKLGGTGSGYDERLPPGAVNDGVGAIQREVIEEMSGALRRSARRIERALVELSKLDDEIRSANGRKRRLELVESFNTVRKEALDARKNYLIQREAIGFFRNEAVLEQYPIPPKRSVVGPHGEDGSIDGDCED